MRKPCYAAREVKVTNINSDEGHTVDFTKVTMTEQHKIKILINHKAYGKSLNFMINHFSFLSWRKNIICISHTYLSWRKNYEWFLISNNIIVHIIVTSTSINNIIMNFCWYPPHSTSQPPSFDVPWFYAAITLHILLYFVHIILQNVWTIGEEDIFLPLPTVLFSTAHPKPISLDELWETAPTIQKRMKHFNDCLWNLPFLEH